MPVVIAPMRTCWTHRTRRRLQINSPNLVERLLSIQDRPDSQVRASAQPAPRSSHKGFHRAFPRTRGGARSGFGGHPPPHPLHGRVGARRRAAQAHRHVNPLRNVLSRLRRAASIRSPSCQLSPPSESIATAVSGIEDANLSHRSTQRPVDSARVCWKRNLLYCKDFPRLPGGDFDSAPRRWSEPCRSAFC